MRHPLILIIADTQIGGSTALMKPGFEDIDGRIVGISKAQRWLYDQFHAMRRRVASLTRRRPLYVFHLGDVIEGNHHRTVQALPALSDQERMAVEVLAPIREMADEMWIVAGTKAHSGDAAQSERRVAERLDAHIDYWFRLEIDGRLHDLAHHGQVSSRTYYDRAVAMVSDVILNCMDAGERVPDFIWRAHRHRVNDSGAHFDKVRGVIVPCWQFRTHYGWTVAPNSPSHIGYVLVHGPDIHRDVEIVRLRPRRRPVIKVDQKVVRRK